MAFIRPFKPSDTEACKHICIATLPPTLLNAPDSVRSLAPYLWTLPFTTLSPSTCLVLDDGNGLAVGYCIGTPSVYTLTSHYRTYTTTVLPPDIPAPKQTSVLEPFQLPDGTVNAEHLIQKAWNPAWLITQDADALNGGAYKGMMHVDILEGWQGQGFGRGLVEGFLGRVKEAREGGVDVGKGCYLGVSPENLKVVGFYERLGWRVWERQDGAEGVTMVIDL